MGMRYYYYSGPLTIVSFFFGGIMMYDVKNKKRKKVGERLSDIKDIVERIAHPEGPKDCPITEDLWYALTELEDMLTPKHGLVLSSCPACDSPCISLDQDYVSPSAPMDPREQHMICNECGYTWTEHLIHIGSEHDEKLLEEDQ
jgi:hypothetical protein